MTVHSAKGLEFPIVIIPGFEDGIFPSVQTTVGTEEDLEEERRLAYVALTRAKEKIYILHTKSRLLYGQTQYNPVSRFVTEIPEEYVTRESNEYSSQIYGIQKPKVYYSENSGTQPTAHKPTQTRPNSALGGGAIVGKPTAPRATNAAKTVFKPGDRVKHMTFGEGEVLSVRPMGADILYEVMFDNAGTKKLMATYARLQKA
jgi:DNA helicase-2/ATP-dependent DNA helicase PcrA